ncbi:IS110 family transposase [Edaphobacter modestus]|uniref:Transposase n=1 Tax=Edaphobacter modestus TaxID=388466 RepID=A0A4Q7YMR6_9BACT|nr:transposase [Edaphobacter modestus]RZU29634.1 transposase [Edaphobacter modestus]RZU38877.1 transposase [Edaphobacter modestus]
MTTMNYIGLDVHKKTISYCVKDVSGRIQQEGKIGSTRRELDCWMKTLPQPWTVAMEATIFSGWIKVAHPLMLRAIAAAKKKNDQIDASKLADCLRCDFLPECHMMPAAIRDRRRTLRYRHLLARQMVQMKNRVSGPLMETGVEYKQATAAQGELLPGIALREQGGSSEHTAAVEAQPGDDRALSKDRVRPGQLSPARSGVGRPDQTTPNGSWRGSDHCTDVALEIGDVSRFRSIKQAISYCGLCGDERSLADKAMRMPLSKQRNKHIQRALVEAAKLAPRQNHEMAVIYDQERQKGNSNRATLAVARKMVAYLLAVDRQQRDFVPAEERRTTAA